MLEISQAVLGKTKVQVQVEDIEIHFVKLCLRRSI